MIRFNKQYAWKCCMFLFLGRVFSCTLPSFPTEMCARRCLFCFHNRILFPTKVLSYLNKKGKEIILLGDTNCDLTTKQADQRIDNGTGHVISLYELFSFSQLIKEPTRVTLDISSIIDHITTTCARNIIKSGVHEVSMSDHNMVYCIRKFNGAAEKGHKMI